MEGNLSIGFLMSLCVNHTLQEYAYEALFQVMTEAANDGLNWAGVYFWLWRTDPWQGGTTDTEFTPHGKPSEKVFYEYSTGDHSGKGFNVTHTLRAEYPSNLVFGVDENVKKAASSRLNGFNFGSGAWSSPEYPLGSKGCMESLQAMKDIGCNSVKIFGSWFYHSYSSPQFAPNYDGNPYVRTPTDDEFSSSFEQAHSLGMSILVSLSPRVLPVKWQGIHA